MTDAAASEFWPKLRLFIAGYMSGAALVSVGHPFDTIKVRLQSEGASGRFSGPLHCLRETVSREGLLALYKGVSPPLLATGFVNSILFSTQTMLVKGYFARDPLQPQVHETMQAALVSGALISLVVTPMEGVKARLQVQYNRSGALGEAPRYAGPIDCIRKVLTSGEGGLRNGLYRGWLCTVYCRMSNWAYFGGYAFFKNYLMQGREGRSQLREVAAGGAAGITYWLTCYPIDLVKNRMQTTHRSDPLYSTASSTIKHIWKSEGYRGFFRGFAPCLLRSFPANAAAFTAFETTLRLLPDRLT